MNKNTLSQDIFVARQPIFDTEQKVVAYELLFRSANRDSAQVTNGNLATATVILEGFPLAQKGCSPNAKFFINFPYDFLTSEDIYLLPKDKIVVEILEDVIIDKNILKAAIELKKKGYILALDDYIGYIQNEKLFKLIDLIKIDVLGMDEDKIRGIILNVKKIKPSIKILAEKVEDRTTFEITKELGAELFQGYFFQKPELIEGKSLSPTIQTKLRLLAILSKKEPPEVDELEKSIKTDISLSYKLLTYINSPIIGLPNKIKSVKQAINLLGIANVVKWCRIFLLTLMNPTNIGIELVKMASIRAFFLANLNRFLDIDVEDDELFLLGLFSLLDAMLNYPMEEVIKEVPLDEIIKDTLVGKKTPLTPYLKLIEAQERGDWKNLLKIIDELKLSTDIIASIYSNALEETEKIFA